ncbi:MAG: putative porin [Dysgonomonas sp.]
MKRYIASILLFIGIFLTANAQNRNISPTRIPSLEVDSTHLDSINFPVGKNIIDTVSVNVPNIYAWKISPRLGERIFVPRDTLVQNFHQSMLVDGKSVAMAYLGNVGSPAQSKIFFERPETSRFIFLDPMYLWRKDPGDQYFLNTKVPYSNVKYQSGGGGESAENRFQSELSMNMGKRLNVGFDFDYVYSRGFYKSLSNKQVDYDFYASYIGDKYKMHAFFHNNNFTNLENGGIKDPLYITNPDAVGDGAGFKGSSLEIPTRMLETRNKMRGRHVYITNRYDLGNDEEEYMVNDTTKAWRKKNDYVPLASAILTTHYTDQRRSISSSDRLLDQTYKYYDGLAGDTLKSPKYTNNIDDYMSYYSFKNTFALAMNEGFRSWTKFGLTAFVEYDMRKYLLPGGMGRGFFETHGENSLVVGGVLSKEKGRYLRYKASAEKDLLRNDFKVDGEITTMLAFGGRKFSVKANAYIKNITPSFFQNHFSSKYWNWDTSFGDTRRVFVGGEINMPELSFSKTRLSGGVENIQNYIYYGANGLSQQNSGSVQVVSLRLDQDLKAGIFHWDNQIVYQKTSNDKVIPLPDLSIYTNVYLMTKIAKVLTVQMGVDAHFHTEYYMPGYEPLTMQFYNQRDKKLGNFPVATAYVNLHLKYTRFYIMMYNLAEGMGKGESFSLYKYPVNPRVLKLGISWQFNN